MDWTWTEEQQQDVFHQFEFVNKFNLETQNPRRDTSISSVSAGLLSTGLPCLVLIHTTFSQHKSISLK